MKLIVYSKFMTKQTINLLKIATMLITLASQAYETFKNSETPEKRKMIKFVFSNLQLRGKKLETSLVFPFDIFEKTTTRSEWRRGGDSNP